MLKTVDDKSSSSDANRCPSEEFEQLEFEQLDTDEGIQTKEKIPLKPQSLKYLVDFDCISRVVGSDNAFVFITSLWYDGRDITATLFEDTPQLSINVVSFTRRLQFLRANPSVSTSSGNVYCITWSK